MAMLFLGVHIRLSTRCKIKFLGLFANYFSLKSLSLSLKMSHECALKLTDLWKTSLLFYLNYEFELIGASLLALAKSINYSEELIHRWKFAFQNRLGWPYRWE